MFVGNDRSSFTLDIVCPAVQCVLVYLERGDSRPGVLLLLLRVLLLSKQRRRFKHLNGASPCKQCLNEPISVCARLFLLGGDWLRGQRYTSGRGTWLYFKEKHFSIIPNSAGSKFHFILHLLQQLLNIAPFTSNSKIPNNLWILTNVSYS